MKRLVIRRAARADVRSIRDWYEREEDGLGARFLAELDHVALRIRTMPQQFPAVRKSLRRALLHRFPYAVYFLDNIEDVIIFAVLHQHRSPSAWKRRAQIEGAG